MCQQFEVMPCYLPCETEKHQNDLRKDRPLTGPRFEPTSSIESNKWRRSNIFCEKQYRCARANTVYTQKNGAASKVNKNLFLTLHGHNVHRQQLQLSKFLMR